ncbi:MAG: hypothetical protein GTO53_09225 [Planctomycetales bacterium]|nr:hypothetical protein [Planctomycetales bacterium]NIM09308.1 hypothetical protein [Planctomycetales bacterium]NIN08776.1 hypothetical protein [Planctomycetales bacterium]NIN77893.1 hypothetical protein [Planctomycetales bacterium]NIO35076.1 hypothetical protein [Planctomycetales bacterium]
MTHIFLAVVGLSYLVLAAWCAWLPERTSRAVGFTLQPGQGQSEFFTVYGGLELALAIIFLWPLYRPDHVAFSLFVCLVIHGCLVLFRTGAFMIYSGFPVTTYLLAITEWIIFLTAAFFAWRHA